MHKIYALFRTKITEYKGILCKAKKLCVGLHFSFELLRIFEISCLQAGTKKRRVIRKEVLFVQLFSGRNFSTVNFVISHSRYTLHNQKQ